MFYRLMITANFPGPPPIDYLRQIKGYIVAHAITINPGEDNAEPSSYQAHRCFHDEHPPLECELIDQWQSPDQP